MHMIYERNCVDTSSALSLGMSSKYKNIVILHYNINNYEMYFVLTKHTIEAMCVCERAYGSR